MTRSATKLFFLLLVLLGSSTPALAAQPFFTIGQADGRWWFFDTNGERFFSAGINVATSGGYYCPACGNSPYYENIMDLYGSVEAWGDVTVERLTAWNFNTLGGWSDYGLLGDRIPYTVVMYMSGADWVSGYVPDYWSQDFYNRVADQAQTCAALADDPQLIGYFMDNEMRWGPDWRKFKTLMVDYMRLPADAPGKAVLVNWFIERYQGNLLDFNRVYGYGLHSWDDLYRSRAIAPLPKNREQADDHEAWTGVVADHFFQVTTDAIREADPNHLILGTRFVSWLTPTIVLEAAAPYLDVVSVNHYLVWPPIQWLAFGLDPWFRYVNVDDMLAEFYEITGKPVLVSEFSFRGLDAAPPSTFPPNWLFMTARDQAQRTEWFTMFAIQCTHSEYVIGYHWFAYMDEPEEGRFDGENSNFGIVDEMDVPYDLLVDVMTASNVEAYDWPF